MISRPRPLLTYTSATQTWTLATAQDNRLGSLSGDNGFIDGQSIVEIFGLGRPSLSRHRRAQYLRVLRVFDGAISVVTEVLHCAGMSDAAPYVGKWGTLPECLNAWRLNALDPSNLPRFAGENTMTALRFLILALCAHDCLGGPDPKRVALRNVE